MTVAHVKSDQAAAETTLPLDGGSIYVRQDGPLETPARLLIHGSGSSTRTWDPMIPLLTPGRPATDRRSSPGLHHHLRRASEPENTMSPIPSEAAWRSRAKVADWLTDSLARRPSGWLARRFYRDPRPHYASFDETLAALTLKANDRLLEIGCGGGALLERALRDAGSAKAIDHSAEMVALARKRNAEAIAAGRLAVVQAEAERLPFADGEFTAAALANVFFFLYEPERVLGELRRVLARGGRLAIHTDAPGLPSWLAPITRRMRLYDDAQLVQLLAAGGFSDATVKRTAGGRGQLATAHRS